MSTGKILAELLPPTSDMTLMYTAPAAGASGTLYMVNIGQAGQGYPEDPSNYDTISVAITSLGMSYGAEAFLLNGTVLPYAHTTALQELYLGAADTLWVSSTNSTTSFVFTGIEY
jgi:hypothetical protein